MNIRSFVCCLPLAFFSPLMAQDGEIPSPEQTVRSLYEAHLADGGALANARGDEMWVFRFDEGLLKALNSEHWGFDPLWFAQDSDVTEVDVKLIDEDGRGRSLVLVSFENFGKKFRLVVALNHTDHGHHIVDIVDPQNGTSLVRDLAPAAE